MKRLGRALALVVGVVMALVTLVTTEPNYSNKVGDQNKVGATITAVTMVPQLMVMGASNHSVEIVDYSGAWATLGSGMVREAFPATTSASGIATPTTRVRVDAGDKRVLLRA
jgi:hypothetical protein